MNKLLIFIILLFSVTSYISFADESTIISNQKKITLVINKNIINIDGKEQLIDVSPIIINGRTLVPLKAITEAFGGKAGWDEYEKKILIEVDSIKIQLNLESTIIIVNNISKTMDVPPTIINNRAMIPIKYISENLGYEARWENEIITITKNYDKDLSPLIKSFRNKLSTYKNTSTPKEVDNIIKESNNILKRILENDTSSSLKSYDIIGENSNFTLEFSSSASINQKECRIVKFGLFDKEGVVLKNTPLFIYLQTKQDGNVKALTELDTISDYNSTRCKPIYCDFINQQYHIYLLLAYESDDELYRNLLFKTYILNSNNEWEQCISSEKISTIGNWTLKLDKGLKINHLKSRLSFNNDDIKYDVTVNKNSISITLNASTTTKIKFPKNIWVFDTSWGFSEDDKIIPF